MQFSSYAPAQGAFFDAVAANPVIAAIKDDAGLEKCLACENIRIVFVLYGDICSIATIISRIKAAGKTAIVHIDLIAGLANKEIAVDFIRSTTQADGIISTRQAFIRRAHDLHLYAILRVFVLDSIALSSLEKLDAIHPDFIDVLPGTMPKTLRKICSIVSVPVLTGGLIADKEDVITALQAGAVAISTTNQAIWEM
ncbi:MAG: glycerol-3-phosphate responsive antiterminator [Faecalibacterium sp.]|nr:glycerol-3-phosphate responsive antiterminator [Faecalibacterium sp.]